MIRTPPPPWETELKGETVAGHSNISRAHGKGSVSWTRAQPYARFWGASYPGDSREEDKQTITYTPVVECGAKSRDIADKAETR
ncbi:hypothetical protein NDU88_006514 [Pleurodeles waltl]|uniref:Uncharacterized protein n=1 Tax=Pleurodeles waltl TaxID=8319 RepID=A0AAV7PRJ9_PLEWA|nr:hypothetical protein NDU88_006514 [Pleurodeles waltl]